MKHVFHTTPFPKAPAAMAAALRVMTTSVSRDKAKISSTKAALPSSRGNKGNATALVQSAQAV